jgi:hypothetical protein
LDYGDDNWKYAQPDEVSFVTGVSGLESSIDKVKVTVKVGKLHTLIYTTPLLAVPEDKRPAVCEFITRANYGLPAGNFEMDWSDGELRYKVFLDRMVLINNNKDASRTLFGAIFGSTRLWERYGDNLLALLQDTAPGKSVSELIAEAESA